MAHTFTCTCICIEWRKNGHATGLTVIWELKMNVENKKLFINNEKDEQINKYIY